jgi:hypothetical protein
MPIGEGLELNSTRCNIQDLVLNNWWTKAEGKADQTGKYSTRAFFGDYNNTENGKAKR